MQLFSEKGPKRDPKSGLGLLRDPGLAKRYRIGSSEGPFPSARYLVHISEQPLKLHHLLPTVAVTLGVNHGRHGLFCPPPPQVGQHDLPQLVFHAEVEQGEKLVSLMGRESLLHCLWGSLQE